MTGFALLAALLAVLIVLGSAVLWIGVPVAGFWVSARVTDEPLGAVLFALLAIPVTMVAFGWLLYRTNARYEEVRGGAAHRRSPPSWRTSLGEERAGDRRRAGGRSLIDVSMTISAAGAILVMAIWFFFFAESPLSPLP